MSQTFDMAAQVSEITYNQALLMYGLGFQIQVEVQGERQKSSTIQAENSIELSPLQTYLINAHICDDDGSYYRPTKFYADLHTLNHCGLHIEYKDKRPPEIEYDTFENIKDKMIALSAKYKELEHYVKNDTLFVIIPEATKEVS